MWLTLALVLGCTPDPAGGPPPSGDDDDVMDDLDDTGTPPEPCDNVVLGVEPAAGATGIAPSAPVTFTLAEPDPAAVVTVTDAAGAEVPGVTTIAGAEVSWVPDPPLAWDSVYTATLDHSCGTGATSWTTGPAPWDPTGIVFAVGLAEGRWVEPDGFGDILADQIDLSQMLVEVTSASLAEAEPTLELLVALGEADVQDLCSHTASVEDAAYAEPDLVANPLALLLPIAGGSAMFHEIELKGRFLLDRSAVVDLEVRGRMDTRALGRAFELGDNDSAVCDFVETFGTPCVMCPDGTPYCLDVTIDTLDGPAVAGPLVERTVPDIEADPSCDS